MTSYAEIAARRLELLRALERLEAEGTDVELPECQQVRLHTGADDNITRSYGVTYQRCGGGRRVIRKRMGGG